MNGIESIKDSAEQNNETSEAFDHTTLDNFNVKCTFII